MSNEIQAFKPGQLAFVQVKTEKDYAHDLVFASHRTAVTKVKCTKNIQS